MTLTMRWGVNWPTYENQQTVVDVQVLIRWGVCWSRSTPRMTWRYWRSFSCETFLFIHFSRFVHFWEHWSQVLAGYLKWLNAAPEPDDEVFNIVPHLVPFILFFSLVYSHCSKRGFCQNHICFWDRLTSDRSCKPTSIGSGYLTPIIKLEVNVGE